MIGRREFITLLGGAAAGWPATALAQRREVRIGLIPLGSSDNSNDLALLDAFYRGLREAGLIKGLNVNVDVVWVKDEASFPQVMRDLISKGISILVPAGTSAALAAKSQTTTIPIVFVTVGDPVGVGLVNSLNNPGGNITGFSDVLLDLSSKYVGLVQELSGPTASGIHYLWYGNWANGRQRFDATDQSARKIGVELKSHMVGDVIALREAVVSMKKDGAVMAIVQPSPFMYRHREELITLAVKHGIGPIFAWPDAAREGALIGYGPDYANMYYRAASYVERILHGMSPSKLPVQQPVKFELVINAKTADAVGLRVPQHLLISADEIVE